MRVIQISPQMRILVAVDSVDGRKGFDSLAQLCREKLQDDPMSGCLYLFRNRRGDTIIALCYDGQGLWHCRKRLSKGRFRFWVEGSGGSTAQALEAHQAQLLLAAGDPSTAAAPVWRPIHGK
jgi:transposase